MHRKENSKVNYDLCNNYTLQHSIKIYPGSSLAGGYTKSAVQNRIQSEYAGKCKCIWLYDK